MRVISLVVKATALLATITSEMMIVSANPSFFFTIPQSLVRLQQLILLPLEAKLYVRGCVLI